MELYDNQTIWSSSEALKGGAVIQVRAWDMTDGNVPGLFNTTILSETSVSKKLVNLLLLRRGCDNKTDFAAKKDRCGVCRGGDECVACDDVPNSNATISKYILLIIIVLSDAGWFQIHELIVTVAGLCVILTRQLAAYLQDITFHLQIERYCSLDFCSRR